jgi:uncharacterized RDD family membrane protein YckC
MRNRGMLGQYAGFFTRAVALLLDMLIVSAIIFVIYWSIRLPFAFFLNLNPDTCSSSSMLPRVERLTPDLLCLGAQFIWTVSAFVAAPLYFVLFYSSTGQTIGKYVMGIRVVRLDGKHMSLGASILRWFGLFLSTVPLGLGFFWVLVDDRRQAWHDKLAHTCVVYAWQAGQDEFVVARIQRWLSGDRLRRPRKDTDEQARGLKYDLLTVAFPEYERLDNVLDLIQDSIAAGQFHIVNATVLVKGADGTIGVLAASDLAVGSKIGRIADEPLALPDYELRRILADVPPESFEVSVVVEERYGDELLRVVSREASALIRRFDLDSPSSPLMAMRNARMRKQRA